MAFRKISSRAHWHPEARYTADVEQEIQIVNCSPLGQLAWITTDDDTIPDLSPYEAAKVAVGGQDNLVLKAGERLWLAYPSLGPDTANVTLQY